MANKRKKKFQPSLKQKLILQFMTEEGMDAVTAAHEADKTIELINKARS